MSKLRRLGAAMMVVAYGLGVLTPAVAFARADRASIVHVLSEAHDGMLILHFHEDDGDHDEFPAKPGAPQIHHCCGVIPLQGLAPPLMVSLLPPVVALTLLPPAGRHLAGLGAVQLDRPPKSL